MKALTESEYLVKSNWPKELKRKPNGCDFKEVGGELIEVKTKLLTTKQYAEMISENDTDKKPYLIDVSKDLMYVFRLERIIKINPHVPKDANIIKKTYNPQQTCPKCTTGLLATYHLHNRKITPLSHKWLYCPKCDNMIRIRIRLVTP